MDESKDAARSARTTRRAPTHTSPSAEDSPRTSYLAETTAGELRAFRTLTDSLPDAVVIFDADGHVLDVNPAAREQYGLTDRDLSADYRDLAPRFEMRAPDESALSIDEWPVARVLLGESLSGLDVSVRRVDDGEARIGRCSGAPVRAENGEIVMAVLIIRDVTAQVAAEKKSARSKELVHCLLDIDHHMSLDSDVSGFTSLALELASAALGACGAAISRREFGGWVTAQLWGMSLSQVGVFHLDAESPTLLAVERTGLPVAMGDVRDAESAVLAHADRIGFRAFMSFPLALRGSVTGVLTFFFAEPRDEFAEEECDFVSRLALTVSLAEENALLFGRERRIAEAFQRALLDLPQDFPEVEIAALYSPAAADATIGGDFYDAFRLADGRIAFTIGDVSGKGLPAAALTALIRDSIRTSAFDGLSPGRVLGKTNRILEAFSPPEVFATAFFCVLDPATGRLSYACAGHPAPIVVGPRGAFRRLEARGPLMGVLTDARFDSRSRTMIAGDTLVLFTDGLTEARGDDSVFGVGGIHDVLSGLAEESPSDVVRALHDAVRRFAGDAIHDDIAILAMRLNG